MYGVHEVAEQLTVCQLADMGDEMWEINSLSCIALFQVKEYLQEVYKFTTNL